MGESDSKIPPCRSPVDPTTKMDIKNVGEHVLQIDICNFHRPITRSFLHSSLWITLIDRFALKQNDRFRGIVNADDVVVAILHHHWVLCNDHYPGERQRLWHAIMDIFCSSITARAGTLVELSC